MRNGVTVSKAFMSVHHIALLKLFLVPYERNGASDKDGVDATFPPNASYKLISFAITL